MKKLKFILCLILITTFNLFAYADCLPGDDECPPTPGDPNTGGPGSQATPIDEYTIYLIGFAIAVAVVYFAMNKYKKSLI